MDFQLIINFVDLASINQILGFYSTQFNCGFDHINFDRENFRGTLKAVPNREDLTMPIQEQLIIELYSK